MSEPIRPDEQARGEEVDLRNAVLLLDQERREFLADLDPSVIRHYTALYARARRWITYARRQAAIAGESGGDATKWQRLEDGWRTSLVEWLDQNLIMSGSIHGRRAQQLVDVLSGARDAPPVGGSQVVVPWIYQPQQEAPAKRRGLWGR